MFQAIPHEICEKWTRRRLLFRFYGRTLLSVTALYFPVFKAMPYRISIAFWFGFRFKYPNVHHTHQYKEEHHTDIGGYFQILIGGLMATSFVVLVLIVLNAYYGKDEKEDEE